MVSSRFCCVFRGFRWDVFVLVNVCNVEGEVDAMFDVVVDGVYLGAEGHCTWNSREWFVE